MSVVLEHDKHSVGNTDEIIQEHVHLRWHVDFVKKSIIGSATLHCKVVGKDGASNLKLDRRGYDIQNIHFEGQESDFLEYEIRKAKFGDDVNIALGKTFSSGDILKITINYSTSQNASAIQWLEPPQTSGKKYPYLFTQCEPVHARSLFPCQDSPGAKLTYTAEVTVDAPLVALMSAASTESHRVTDMIVYSFKQPVPVPSYLVCLAVGELESRKLSDRCQVWSEPSQADAAAYEFQDTEKFLQLGEEICGKYEWGRYDILLLPPSFPYGGMENPCLTFVTPTLLAGDRSLVNVIMHEIAHSWTGNLVTNATWENFYLNEGFTVFVERKIIGRKDGQAAADFGAIIGLHDLEETIDHFGASNPLTCLNTDLTETDPDDSFSSVPYEKGFNFLYYLEGLVGGPSEFEPYLKAHLKEFAFKTVTTKQFKDFFMSYFEKKNKTECFKDVDWEAWFKAPGMCPVKNNFDDSLAVASEALANKWINASESDYCTQFGPKDIEAFLSNQKVNFLSKLVQHCKVSPLSHALLKGMDSAYNFHNTKNCEIKFQWYTLCLRCGLEDIVEPALEFVTSVGRMKYVRPLYRDLYAFEKSKARAVDTFTEHKSFYHIICSNLVSKDLEITK